MRKWLVGVALLGLAVTGAWFWINRDIGPPPTFTCSLPSPEQRCVDTEQAILDDSFPAFVPELSGDLIAVDIRPAPDEWSSSVDPGFQAAEWAAWLERDRDPPILAACYYSSDAMVTCHTEERPFAAPSN